MASAILKLLALFKPKLKLFVSGRKAVFQQLATFKPTKKVLWIHCASLGEFEQGRPILENAYIQDNYTVVLTFFSPSGYEVQKNYAKAALVLYLPLDTSANAKRFVDLLQPAVVLFVKYEIWPNYLRELGKQKTKTLLVSGIFREKQFLFKPLGAFIRKAFFNFTHCFVQDETSKKLLEQINYTSITVSGDTRFDRVYSILQQDNHLAFMDEFVQDKKVLVAGSTWAEDEDLLVNYCNNNLATDLKIIIAPHNINPKAIAVLQQKLKVKTGLFSAKAKHNLADYDILIVDTVGLLTKIYSYATMAYVGGGFGSAGIHNILEPATFGVPIIIGPVFQTFKEAVDLVQQEALFVIHNQAEFDTAITALLNDEALAETKGQLAQAYIKANVGATEAVVSYLVRQQQTL